MDRIEPTLGDLDLLDRPRPQPAPAAAPMVTSPVRGGDPVATGTDNDFNDRLSPARFAAWWLLFLFAFPFVVLGLFGVAVGAIAIAGPWATLPAVAVGVLAAAAIVAFLVSLVVRRLHDLDAPGWWALLLLVPVANLVFLFALALAPGTRGNNRYGAPNPPAPWLLRILIALLLLVPLLGLPFGLRWLQSEPSEPVPIPLRLP